MAFREHQSSQQENQCIKLLDNVRRKRRMCLGRLCPPYLVESLTWTGLIILTGVHLSWILQCWRLVKGQPGFLGQLSKAKWPVKTARNNWIKTGSSPTGPLTILLHGRDPFDRRSVFSNNPVTPFQVSISWTFVNNPTTAATSLPSRSSTSANHLAFSLILQLPLSYPTTFFKATSCIEKPFFACTHFSTIVTRLVRYFWLMCTFLYDQSIII